MKSRLICCWHWVLSSILWLMVQGHCFCLQAKDSDNILSSSTCLPLLMPSHNQQIEQLQKNV